jgi:hypothetical protein
MNTISLSQTQHDCIPYNCVALLLLVSVLKSKPLHRRHRFLSSTNLKQTTSITIHLLITSLPLLALTLPALAANCQTEYKYCADSLQEHGELSEQRLFDVLDVC